MVQSIATKINSNKNSYIQRPFVLKCQGSSSWVSREMSSIINEGEKLSKYIQPPEPLNEPEEKKKRKRNEKEKDEIK